MPRTPRTRSVSPSLFACLLGAVFSLAACHARTTEEERPALAGNPSPDLLLDPTGRKLQYLKIAEATVLGAAHSTAATGKIAFDEDHTSRVGSPLSGRVETL